MVLEAIEVVVQVVASAVLAADSEEASEEAASQAVGNPCKTPACYFRYQDLPVKWLKRFIRNKFRNKGKKPCMLVYFKLSP